jgi:hypothetical protein
MMFDSGLSGVRGPSLRLMLVQGTPVVVADGLTEALGAEASLFTLPAEVGLTVPMRLVIMAATLARGVVALPRHQALVRRRDALPDFGTSERSTPTRSARPPRARPPCGPLDISGSDEQPFESPFFSNEFAAGLKSLGPTGPCRRTQVGSRPRAGCGATPQPTRRRSTATTAWRPRSPPRPCKSVRDGQPGRPGGVWGLALGPAAGPSCQAT